MPRAGHVRPRRGPTDLHRGRDVLVELVDTEQREDLVVLVREDDVPARVHLEDDVEAAVAAAEAEVDHAVDAQLRNVLEPLGADVLA